MKEEVVANYIQFKVRPVVKYFGGKSFLARRIIELIPDSEIFVEPFAGGLNVLLNKCKYGKEIVGDLNTELIHLYETIRDYPEFLDRLKGVPYTEEVFTRALAAGVVEDPVDRALHFLIRHRMSRSGMGDSFSYFDATEGHERNGWASLCDELPFTVHRLQGVEFYNRPALELIDLYDGPNTSFYLDPPYYPATRQAPKVYDYEMTQFQHLLLLKRIVKCQGNVVISGYDNPTYNKELRGWEKYEFKMANHASQVSVKETKTEVVWVKQRQLV